MAKTSKRANQTSANIGFEKQIWDAACVLWTDNQEMGLRYENVGEQELPMAAEARARYGNGADRRKND